MPNNFNDVSSLSYFMAVVAGLWGAIITYARREHNKNTINKKILLFLYDAFVTMGITILAYIGLLGAGVNELLAVAIGGVLGHQGTRSIYIVELLILERLGAKETIKEIKKL